MPMMPQGKFASGGMVGAYLSNGEFVVKASAVKKPGALGFLNSLNYYYTFPVKYKPYLINYFFYLTKLHIFLHITIIHFV